MKIFTQSVYILCKNRERKCAADFEHIFYVEDCATASGNISMYFKERATASEKLLRKNVRLVLKSIKRKKCATAFRSKCAAAY